MKTSFVHLHLHTEYSLADGTVRIPELVATTAEMGQPAVAITDIANIYGMVKFYQAALARGVKPIFGVDAWIANPEKPSSPYKLVLLVKDSTGYRNICEILTRAYREGQHSERPCISREWLRSHSGGLIALSAAQAGEIGAVLRSGNMDKAVIVLDEYQQLFGNGFYIELQRLGRPYEEEYIAAALELAALKSVPVVATNDVHFMTEDDYDAHEVRVCIHDGRTLNDPRRPHRYTTQQYLRSADEMAAVFPDIPEAIENTVQIARRCNFFIRSGDYYLPDYPVPEGETIESLLRREAETGMARRFAELPEAGGAPRSDYDDRIKMELDVINQMGFPGYFLIVADFIRWAVDNDVPVGPGRGSGAGSIVAYALGITQVDPIEHGLLFERFLNPERVSMPDFDIDFCMEGRDRVIEYVAGHYGRETVSQIITFGSMAAKAVVRDVGRVLGMAYGFVDTIAKLIPFELGITLEKAMKQEELLRERYENEDEITRLIDMAMSLEGLSRNVGRHAGGVVIAPSKVTDFTPLYCEQGSDQLVTQLDMKDLETLGLVKFDFLGLRTLTVIDWAVKSITEERLRQGETPLDIARLPMDDPRSFELLKSCKTTALFQLESRGMRDLIKKLQPDCFDDLVALVALYRPGPLGSGMVDDFVDRKHGRKSLRYPHPLLEPILKPTYGIILYQEQVMEIARVMGGYSLGEADLLRRAMGKKDDAGMARQRGTFMDGARIRQIEEKPATHIFDLMQEFGKYGFNKSHSVAYAMIAYQTAWLKAHYPSQFMAAAMSADMEHTDKIVTLINDARGIDLSVENPDVNRCFYNFRATTEREILYGLGAIKGIGQSVIENIVEARDQDGAFSDLFELCDRIDLKRVNRRALESLIRSGALDALGPHRASLMASLGVAMDAASQRSGDRDAGQDDMFGIAAPKETVSGFQQVPEWEQQELLAGEKDTLGLYLSGHPIDLYVDELSQVISSTLVDVNPGGKHSVSVAGLVVGMRMVNTRRGDRMAVLTLDDKTSQLDVTVFGEVLHTCRDILRKDAMLVVRGKVSNDQYTGGVRMGADEVYDIALARESLARRLQVTVRQDQLGNGLIGQLKDLLQPTETGHCRLGFSYISETGICELITPEECFVVPRQNVVQQLQELVGPESVRIYYR